MRKTASFVIISLVIFWCVGWSLNVIAATYDPVVEKAQKRLTELGYDPGPVDGKMGGKTEVAIRQFQQDNELTVNGKLDKQTKAELLQIEEDEALSTFIDQGDGTILDQSTGLMWHQKDVSLSEIIKAMNKTENEISFQDINQYVKELKTGGYNDWRIPTAKEFSTIQKGKGDPDWISEFHYSVGVYIYITYSEKESSKVMITSWICYCAENNLKGIRPVRGQLTISEEKKN